MKPSIGSQHPFLNINNYCVVGLNSLVGSEKLVCSCFAMFKLICFMFDHLQGKTVNFIVYI